MTLEFISDGSVWTGQTINDVKHPSDIELKWTAEELQAIGLQVRPIPTPTGPTVDDVVAERTRRLSLGFNYDFQDARGVHHIGTTATDMAGWEEVTKKAQAKIALGKENETFVIYPNMSPVTVTSLEWMQILEAADAMREPIWLASFALQAMDPIPTDYATNESYWVG